jgi:hypothetical protein
MSTRFKGRLRARFIEPPFSILNAASSAWQERKWAWASIEGRLGRDAPVYYRPRDDPMAKKINAVNPISAFDPVLCEILYHWFCPPTGQILDPFAGGSTRGIVASCCGYRYHGIDLSLRQIEANRAQLTARNCGEHPPVWEHGDSRKRVRHDREFDRPVDFVFSCPPYGDIERYSDDEFDLSNMNHHDFLEAYRDIIAGCCGHLKDSRFAAFVVGNYRNKKTGMLYDLVGQTIKAFALAGLSYYNELILAQSIGTASVRAPNIFDGGRRKITRVHQTVVVCVKGSPPDENWE